MLNTSYKKKTTILALDSNWSPKNMYNVCKNLNYKTLSTKKINNQLVKTSIFKLSYLNNNNIYHTQTSYINFVNYAYHNLSGNRPTNKYLYTLLSQLKLPNHTKKYSSTEVKNILKFL